LQRPLSKPIFYSFGVSQHYHLPRTQRCNPLTNKWVTDGDRTRDLLRAAIRSDVIPLVSQTYRSPLAGAEEVLNKISYLGGGGAEEEPYDPISRNPRPVLRALQFREVDRPPEEGSRNPREAHAHHLVDGEAAAQLH
jgi:hypothetical protein